MNRQNWWRFTNRPNSILRLFASQKSTSFEKEVKEPCSFLLFKRRDVGIPPYCILYGNGSSGRRPLRFLWIRAKLAVRRISLLPSAKISHCVSNISHAFAYITRISRGGYHPPEKIVQFSRGDSRIARMQSSVFLLRKNPPPLKRR